jgi:hypothetical protein
MNQTQKDRRLAEFETRLRQRAAEQYPEPTPEQTTRLEVKVSRAVEEYGLKLSRQADERRQEAERAQAFDAYRSMQPQPSQEMDLER